MAIASIRILADLALPSGMIRLWDGSGGTFVDAQGNMYSSCVLTDDAIDSIELAINAEAFTLGLVLNGLDAKTSNTIWTDFKAGTIKGSVFRLMLQKMDGFEQPVGDPSIKFTGRVDNLTWNDGVSGNEIRSNIKVEITNRFTMRTLTSGAVLSDVDQKARAKVLNPAGTPDKFCERVPLMRDKTVSWPNWP